MGSNVADSGTSWFADTRKWSLAHCAGPRGAAMLMLEHDAKELLAAHGVAVPAGILVGNETGDHPPPFAAPWFVKAQIPAGGRGKAGGIVRAESDAELADALARLIGARIKGHLVQECRIEQAVAAFGEAYLSLSVDPATGRIHVLVSSEGGVDIEDEAHRAAIASADCARDEDAIRTQIRALADTLGEPAQSALGDGARSALDDGARSALDDGARSALDDAARSALDDAARSALDDAARSALDDAARSAICDAGDRLAPIFCRLEATLLEINPLLVMQDGSWVAGDAKVIVDENALVRQPTLTELVERRTEAYPEAARKLAEGFDYVELDPEGDIALVTTGAGLSMQLIDELLERGCHPFNFCDIRSGNFRGDPARLIQVLRWIAAGPSVRSVLVNFFAGITHLGELSRLLLAALEAVPELRAPVTVRLIGNGLEEARAILQASGSAITVEPDLEKAVAQAIAHLREAS